MGIFKLPCGSCSKRIECLAEESECLMKFCTLLKTFGYAYHSNPGLLIVFIGVVVCYGAGLSFILSYFETSSVKIIVSGAATALFGLCFVVVHAVVQENLND